MKVAVFYVGSSLLSPLRQAEREINRDYALELQVAAYNFGAPLSADEWREVERVLSEADLIFITHVTDAENAARLIALLRAHEARHRAVVVINCLPDLMRRTRMGKLRFGGAANNKEGNERTVERDGGEVGGQDKAGGRARRLVSRVGAWMGEQARARRGHGGRSHAQYQRLIERMPALLRFVPNAGPLRDIKHYLYLFAYFLQPTPANIRSMLLYALKHYVLDERQKREVGHVALPETPPAAGLYHPDAPAVFASFEEYRKWYQRRAARGNAPELVPAKTIGLLLMRTQIVSGARKHYDGLIRALEAEGLAVLPAISTFMDNREACAQFFAEQRSEARGQRSVGKQPGVSEGRKERVKESEGKKVESKGKKVEDMAEGERDGEGSAIGEGGRARVSQIVSLTGFSFVGGPAMNDSEAAVEFLRGLNRPFRSAVSLDMQTIEAWQASRIGLNPVQAGMQVAIPEIDGATEPFVFGGLRAGSAEPEPLAERCQRVARRVARWNRLRTAERAELRLALALFCFPPNKGNLGTAADLDVFPSVWEILRRLEREGYEVEVPASADELRERMLGGNSAQFGAAANVAYRLSADEYLRLCPYARGIEAEWGAAPGALNSFGNDLLIQGIKLGNVFLGAQPTFGYEGDPMRLLMAQSGAPHHGFAAFYTYIEKIFRADAVAHVGTHGALEFMPGKQVGLSASCWPDRLIGELPHIYLYSVNNPSEGTIARRRSYAELISYLTPPVADAGLYRDLVALKELLQAYRRTDNEDERAGLYAEIEQRAEALRFEL